MIPAMPGIEEVCYVMVNSFVTWRLRFRFSKQFLTPAFQIARSGLQLNEEQTGFVPSNRTSRL